MQIILASNSPRRRRLMRAFLKELKARPPFLSQGVDIDESPIPAEQPLHYVKRLSQEKALALLQKIKMRGTFVIIAADTTVVLGTKIFGKPKNKTEAKKTLRHLSGKTHTVLTGVTFLTRKSTAASTQLISHIVTSRVAFKKLTHTEIEKYVQTKEPLDKAGAYGIQGGAKKFIKQIKGSITNVMGLPMELVSDKLSALLRG